MARTGYWQTTFRQGDSFAERTRALNARADDAEAGEPCARGDWCEERTVRIENGERKVTPARTWRAFCESCSRHIGRCLSEPEAGLTALYVRMAAELGEARQSEILIRVPFGPAIPLSEAIDAHMRAMTEIMCSWEERIRDVARLSAIPDDVVNRPQDRLCDLERSLSVISPRLSVLLGLGPQEMVRVLPPWAVGPGDEVVTILSGDGSSVRMIVMLGGRRAGEEVMHLHYFARRLLLETTPPQPILPDFRCRVCEMKTLRRSAPPWHQDSVWFWSRCDHCKDEMTREEYDVNAKRWLAWEKAHLARPVLAEVAAAS
jgi:hypothetical protein